MNRSQVIDRYQPSSTVRQRDTPTFYHHNIFANQQQNQYHHIRYTPTFQSTVFNCDGYQIQTHHSRTLKQRNDSKKVQHQVVYSNNSTEKKQAFFNPYYHYTLDGVNKKDGIIDEKARINQQINQFSGRTSRMRKCVEMMSNPIFGGYVWQPAKQNVVQVNQYNQNAYKYNKSDKKEKNQVNFIEQVQQHKNQVAQYHQSPKINLIKQSKRPYSPKQHHSKNAKHQNNLKRFKSATNINNKLKI